MKLNDKIVVEKFVGADFQACMELVWRYRIGDAPTERRTSRRSLLKRSPWTRSQIKEQPDWKSNDFPISAETLESWISKPEIKPSRSRVEALCGLIEKNEARQVAQPIVEAIRAAWESLVKRKVRNSSQAELVDLQNGLDRHFRNLSRSQRDSDSLLVLGPSYVDIDVNNAPPRGMSRNVEHASTEHGEPRLGGSGLKFAAHWKRLTGKKSHLVTAISAKRTPLVDLHETLLEEICDQEVTAYISGYTKVLVDSGPPVSIILNHKQSQASTTYTSKRGLDGFTWPKVMKHLEELDANGGILYLSGLEKTALTDALVENLSKLSTKYFISLDIGRLDPFENERSHRTPIGDALLKGIINIAFGTYMEYLRLHAQPLPRGDRGKFCMPNRIEKLKQLQSHRNSESSICVIRDFNFLKELETGNAKGVIQIVLLIGRSNPIDLSDKIFDKPRKLGFSKLAREFDARVVQGLHTISHRKSVVLLEEVENIVVDAANAAFT